MSQGRHAPARILSEILVTLHLGYRRAARSGAQHRFASELQAPEVRDVRCYGRDKALEHPVR